MIIKKKYFRQGRRLISISAFLHLPWTEQLIQKKFNRIFLKRLYARLKRNKRLHPPFGGRNGCVIKERFPNDFEEIIT